MAEFWPRRGPRAAAWPGLFPNNHQAQLASPNHRGNGSQHMAAPHVLAASGNLEPSRSQHTAWLNAGPGRDTPEPRPTGAGPSLSSQLPAPRICRWVRL